MVLRLRTLQRSLKALQLGPLSNIAWPLLQPHSTPAWIPMLECLIIPRKLGSFDDLNVYGRVLKTSPHLKHLAINCRSTVDPNEDGNRFNDGVTYDSRIVKRLFRDITRSYNDPPLKLEKLELSEIRLKHGDRTFLQIIDFAKITRLTLTNCPDSTKFLRHLNQQFRTRSPALKHLKYEAQTVHSAVLAEFLGLLNGLITLHVSIESLSMKYRDVLVSAVLQHAPTLQEVLLRRSWKVMQDKLLNFGKQMVNLRQIGVALPEILMDDADEEEWGEFGDAVAAIAAAPNLTLFRLLSWPNPPAIAFDIIDASAVPDEDELSAPVVLTSTIKSISATLMDSFATKLMHFIEKQTKKPSPILVFGTRDRNDPVDCEGVRQHVQPTAYVPGKQIDVFGQMRRIAIRTEPHLLQYIDEEIGEVATKWLYDCGEES